MTETQAQRIVRIVTAEVGYHEGHTGSRWNNHQKFSPAVPGLEWSQDQPWCATFVSWAALTADLATLYPRTASCDVAGQWFKDHDRWSEYPAVGAQVFYGSPSDLNHTGLVTGYDATYVYTIEGNTNTTGSAQGDGVYRQKRPRRSPHVVGYGYPKFLKGIQTADPSLKWKKAPTPPPSGGHKPDPIPSEPPATDPTRYAGDYSVARPDLAALHAAGVRGLGRYLTSEVEGSQKPYTRPEAEAILAAGMWYYAIFESTASRADGNHAAGAADAKRAEAAADALGYPRTCAIFYAVDFDADPSRIGAYFQGVRDNARRPVGDYGSYQVVQASKCSWHWQTEAWSHGRVSPRAHLLQKIGHRLKPVGVAAGAWDENLILHGKIPVHNPGEPFYVPSRKPPVEVKPKEIRIVQANVQHTDPLAQVAAYIRSVAQPVRYAPDVITWNELGTDPIRRAVSAMPGYLTYIVGDVGISWRTARLTLIASKATKVNPGVLHLTPNRYILSAVLADTANARSYMQKAGQSVHHVDVGGLARIKGALLGQNGRAKKYFAALAVEIAADAKNRGVVFCGDLNVDYLGERKLPADKRTKWFPLTVLGKVARVFMSPQGTHGSRAIDWVLLAGKVVGLRSNVLPRGTSDHNAVVTVITLD